MSAGFDKPRDWRAAYLDASSSLSSPKRKDGPDDREYDARGEPRHRSDLKGNYRGSDRRRGRGGYRGDNHRGSYRDRGSGNRGEHHSYSDRQRSDALPYSDHESNSQNPSKPPNISIEDKEDGEISPRPTSTNINPRDEAEASSTPLNGQSITLSPAEPEPEIEIPSTPPPIEDIIAERRAKRAFILAKYAAAQSGTSSQPTGQNSVGNTSSPAPNSAPVSTLPSGAVSVDNHVQNKAGSDGQATPNASTPGGDFALSKDAVEQASITASVPSTLPSVVDVSDLTQPAVADETISAADYDPSMDRREEDARHAAAVALASGTGEVANNQPEIVDEEEEGEDEEDDDFDMFAIPDDKPKKKKKATTAASALTVPKPIALTSADNAADAEGYYQIVLGEALDGGRYQVFSILGKGMFSAVVRARVIEGEGVGREVAIKIIRAQESMFKAGQKEIQILNKLMQADPEDKKHIIRLERTFEHRGHLCLVFESLSMNLREVVKRFGKDVGLNLGAVRAYSFQLFLSLSHLKRCNIMHADIKPDNILVNEQKNNLKLCDLGSASDVSENDIAPYLVSRFYRAPEIILGLPYDTSLDMWSIGCTLYELYTGKILFPGRTNNQMLLHMMEVKGRFASKMIKKARFGDVHFDDNGVFLSVELDKLSGKEHIRKVNINKPKRDLRSRLIPSGHKMKEEEAKLLASFVDLLDKCLSLDPAKRITAKEALLHPFVRG